MTITTKETNVRFKCTKIIENLSIGFAEYFGTTIIVFVSCLGSSKWLVGGDIPAFQSSFAAGLAVTMAIHNFGHISGAHVNPVTTVCALILEQIPAELFPVYIIAQLAGGATGYGLVRMVTPKMYMTPPEGYPGTPTAIGMHVPSENISPSQALTVEIIITLILVFANCSAFDPRAKHLIDSVSIRFGLIVAGLNFAAGAYTGGSMNPARSFGPALWNNDWHLHWIYWVGPLSAAITGSMIYKYLFLKTNFIIHGTDYKV